MSDPIITVDHLRKVYEPYSRAMRLLLRTSVTEPVVALDDVSLEINAGEMWAVLGPNGAGKSTLFRILTGLTTPTSGSASILGYDVTKKATAIRRLVGFMPAEQRTLLLRHTCRENLAFHGRLQGISRRHLADKVDETLELVGLYNARDRVGFALSSGMLARLLLARAIMHDPSVLILDEPTGAVDPLGAYELLQLIQRIATEREIAVLISSHRLDEVEMLNDHVLLLNHGRMVYSGELASMSATVRQPRIEILFDDEDSAKRGLAHLEEQLGVTAGFVEDKSVVLTADVSLAEVIRHMNGQVGEIRAIEHAQPKLRDVLREMLQDQVEEAR